MKMKILQVLQPVFYKNRPTSPVVAPPRRPPAKHPPRPNERPKPRPGLRPPPGKPDFEIPPKPSTSPPGRLLPGSRPAGLTRRLLPPFVRGGLTLYEWYRSYQRANDPNNWVYIDWSQLQFVCGYATPLWSATAGLPTCGAGPYTMWFDQLYRPIPFTTVCFVDFAAPDNSARFKAITRGWAQPKTGWRNKMTSGYAYLPDVARPIPEVVPYLPPVQPEPKPDPIPWTDLPRLRPSTKEKPKPGQGGHIVHPALPPVFPGPAPNQPPPKSDPNFPGNPPHKPEPPKPGTKEKKLRVPPMLMAALKAGHQVTEWKDMIDAIWDGVPMSVRQQYVGRGRTRKGARIGEGKSYFTPDQKAEIIYRHINEIDWQIALTSLAKNQLEDKLMGWLNSKSDARSNKSLGGNRFLPF